MTLIEKSKKPSTPLPPMHFEKGVIRDYFEFIMWGLCIFIFFGTYIWQNFKIPTSSMENTITIGDHITLNSMIYSSASPWEKALMPIRDIRRGDVVVFKYPGDTEQKWVKRCIGLPGEEWELQNDYVYINGKRLDEPYTFYRLDTTGMETTRDSNNQNRPFDYNTLKPGIENAAWRKGLSINLQEVVRQTYRKMAAFEDINHETYKKVVDRLNNFDGTHIPEGFYLMMGDNRNYSFDSRFWGLVPQELVEGRPHWIWWSYGEEEGTDRAEGVGFIWVYARIPFTFLFQTHWSDCFRVIK